METTTTILPLVIIAGLLPHVTTGGPSANVVGLPMGPGFNMEPYFVGGSGQIVNMTVLKGQTARMECRVQNLGAKQVSWIRHSDVHILAVGQHTFTSDARFASRYHEHSGRFTLSIRPVQKSDEGTYECQISTKPTKSFVVHVKVKEPSTMILSEPAIHVEQDSALNLTCIIKTNQLESDAVQNRRLLVVKESDQTSINAKIVWFKDSKFLSSRFGKGRGTITNSVSGGGKVSSNLYVAKATLADSGNYTCSSSMWQSVKNSSVKVHILVDGESPNAWKTNKAANRNCNFLTLLKSATSLIIFTYGVQKAVISSPLFIYKFDKNM